METAAAATTTTPTTTEHSIFAYFVKTREQYCLFHFMALSIHHTARTKGKVIGK
jgi:hypothetical protein